MKKIVVIGGGIAGLSAAYYASEKISKSGLAVNLTVIERESRWGGKIDTRRVNGFVIEGGPDTFLATKPWGLALCQELGLGERLHGTNPDQKNTYVLHRNQLMPLPDGLTMMVPTQFGPMVRTGLLSWISKARMGMDYLLPPKPLDGDESLGAFVSRRLGRAAYENLIEPLMSGIYAGDGDLLSLEATFPSLRELELEHGGLVKGVLARKRAMVHQNTNESEHPRRSGNRSVFLTPTTGLAEIVEALIEQLSTRCVELRAGAGVRRLTAPAEPGSSYTIELDDGEILRAEGVILATPAYASGELLYKMDPQLAVELSSISYTSTATISLAYRQADVPRPLDGYGYVIPRREGRNALACTWTSVKFPHRAPQGYVLLRVFIGRAGQEEQVDWAENSLLEVAREEVRMTLGIIAEPVLHFVRSWEKAMPQYNLGHPQRIRSIDERLKNWPGLALAGNGYSGIGIPDCIHSGELAADRVVEYLAA